MNASRGANPQIHADRASAKINEHDALVNYGRERTIKHELYAKPLKSSRLIYMFREKRLNWKFLMMGARAHTPSPPHSHTQNVSELYIHHLLYLNIIIYFLMYFFISFCICLYPLIYTYHLTSYNLTILIILLTDRLINLLYIYIYIVHV